jgi:glycosyltransferase involved in cell wall biosynthesis
MPEVAGDAAAYVNPYNVTSIRNGIKRVLNNEPLRRSLITGGYSNVTRFDPNTIADHYAQLYGELSNKYTTKACNLH